MGRTLSQVLLGFNFMPVYGTTEKVGKQRKLVSTGTPFTWDTSNGISVVCDEQGRPWIKRGDLDLSQFSDCHTIMMGAYVPHSNDGGEYVCLMLEGCPRTAPVSERKMRGLMQVIERIIAIDQILRQKIEVVPFPSPLAQWFDELAKLSELAKLIYRAKDEADIQETLREL